MMFARGSRLGGVVRLLPPPRCGGGGGGGVMRGFHQHVVSSSSSSVGGRPLNAVLARRTSSTTEAAAASTPDSKTLRTHFVHCAFPMVGFGFMDNIVMIQVGDLIDSTIGVTFGFATLTSAAFGQVFSDVSGVCFGGAVEALATKVGLPIPNLTPEQRHLPRVKTIGTIGGMFGVVLGCLLGMTSLLFMDLEKAEREKRQAELDTIFQTVLVHGEMTVKAERCSLFLVDEEKGELWSRLARGEKDIIRAPIFGSIAGACFRSGKTLNIKDAYLQRRFSSFRDVDKKTGFRTKSVLCGPVKDTEGKVVAVIQMINKKGGDGHFDNHDVDLVEMLCTHVAIFIERVGQND